MNTKLDSLTIAEAREIAALFAWVADTGRFADALKSCNFNEVEPFPDGRVIINRASVIDAIQIEKLNRSQK